MSLTFRRGQFKLAWLAKKLRLKKFMLIQLDRFQQFRLGECLRPNFRGFFRLAKQIKRVELFAHDRQQVHTVVADNDQLVSQVTQPGKHRYQRLISLDGAGCLIHDHQAVRCFPDRIPKFVIIFRCPCLFTPLFAINVQDK